MLMHVGIPGIEIADRLAKQGRNLTDGALGKTTLYDTNSIARQKKNAWRNTPIKVDSHICEINAKIGLSKTITRLRIRHFQGKKIHKEGTISSMQQFP
ncbi:hypothetical protein TNCV_50751 [Trichonephila clavipes]|nr:hypothetical protein TNCV_50751 [Trichonephila clavipes]